MRRALLSLAMLTAHAAHAAEPDDVTAALLRAPSYPGSPWRVHDLRRPQPRKVEPGACVTVKRPPDAVNLFDGHDTLSFQGARLDLWRVKDGALVSSGAEHNRIASKAAFGDVQIHLEFKTPVASTGVGQYRANSGLFLMGLYEVQILDSWNNPTYADGQLGALYGQEPPLVNASLPPGAWQCLDVVFRAPRFDGETLLEAARATVTINGVVVQNNAAFRGPTVFAALSAYRPHAAQLAFTLQDHGDASPKVAFRNIWARRLEETMRPHG
jgi:hypothetical protein